MAGGAPANPATLVLTKKRAPLWRPSELRWWLSRAATGCGATCAPGPGRNLGRNRLLGGRRVPKLGRVLQPAGGLRDGPEGAVEDSQRALGDTANDIAAAGLK